MGMCREVSRQIKVREWMKSLVLFVLICLGMPCEIHAEPVEQDILLEQLTEAFAKGNVYEVIQDGSGDFTTIQAGVDAAESEDTLLIYPGIYNEAVEIYGKTVNLIGTDRENCVLQYESIDYNKVPLTFGAGLVANMTIYGYHTGEEKQTEAVYSTNEAFHNATIESIEAWQEMFPGYAVHIDQNYSYEKEICMNNCKIVSNNSQCVGIGCRGKNNITFSECELISNGMGGCIYFHNTDSEEMSGDAYFTLKNCSLRNYKCPYVFSMHSMGAQNPVYLTFQNVKITTIAYERKGAYNSTNMNTGDDADAKAGIGEPVTYLNRDKSFEFVTSLRYEVSDKEEAPTLSEGINYLKMVETNPEYVRKEKLAEVQARKRHVFDIYNSSKFVGDGWCGLEYMYLTPESYGNTFSEMNAPVILVEEASEIVEGLETKISEVKTLETES